MNLNATTFASAWLRLRLALRRVNPVLAAILVCLLAGSVLAGWLLGALDRVAIEYETARVQARAPAPAAPPAPPPSSAQNLSAC